MNAKDNRFYREPEKPDDSRIVLAPDEQQYEIIDIGEPSLVASVQCKYLRPCANPQRCLSADMCLGNCERP